MNRIKVITYDAFGEREKVGWFDLDAATEIINEDTRWNGNSNVSVHTNDEFDHQRLILTAGRAWVLEHSSQWQGRETTYKFITDDEAREWLLINDSDDVVCRYFGEPEPERSPGRPAIGGKIPPVDLGNDLLARLDAEAASTQTTRAATVRQLLTEALDARDKARSNR